MKKSLILHIGMFKTGTSSIQETLYNSHEILREKNVYYSSELHPHNLTFFPIFYEEPELLPDWQKVYSKEQARKKQIELKKQWVREIVNNSYNTFIISSENVSLWDEVTIKKAFNFIKIYFDEIKIIIYLREHSSYFSSAIQQIVKNGFINKDIHQILKEEIMFLNYKELIKKWVKVFGSKNIIVRKFDATGFKNNDLIDDFFDSIGLGDISSKQLNTVKANESIGKNSIIFLSELNKKYPVIINGTINEKRGLAKRYIPLEIFEAIQDEKFHLDIKYTQDEATYINEQVDFVNVFLPNNQQFKHVEASDEETVIPKPNEIPIEYFVELINEYNKYLEKLIDQIEISNSQPTWERESCQRQSHSSKKCYPPRRFNISLKRLFNALLKKFR